VKKYETDADKLKSPVAIPKTKEQAFSHPRRYVHARSGLQSQSRIYLGVSFWERHEGKLSLLSFRLIKESRLLAPVYPVKLAPF